MEKILFAIPTLDGGGAEKVLVNLCNGLANKNVEITVLLLFDEGIHKERLNAKIRRLTFFKKRIRGIRFILKLLSPEALAKKVEAEKYDIVISYLEGTMTRILSGCSGDAKKIAWVHSKLTDKNIKEHYRSRQEALNCYNRYDRIICVSQEVRNQFLTLFPQICPQVVDILRNVNESDDVIRLSREKTEMKYNEVAINAVVVGKMVESKGIFRIALAFELYPKELKKLKVYFVGDGADRARFEQHVQEKGIADNLIVLGYQANPYKWMRQADFLICPSYTEGLSTAVTEALILGLPVITTDCGGMKELLGDSQFGKIVKNEDLAFAEELVRFVKNEDERKTYGTLALQRGKAFMKDAILDQTISFFHGVINDGVTR